MTQLGERFGFDLANAFTRELELAADLLESERRMAVEAEAQCKHLLLALLTSAPMPAAISS